MAVSIKMITRISRIRIAEIEAISTAGEVVETGTVEVVEIGLIVAIGLIGAIVAVATGIKMDAEGEISELLKE